MHCYWLLDKPHFRTTKADEKRSSEKELQAQAQQRCSAEAKRKEAALKADEATIKKQNFIKYFVTGALK